jgi:hypothetical protein
MSEVVAVGLLMLCVPVALIAFALFMSARYPIDCATTRPQAEGDGDG